MGGGVSAALKARAGVRVQREAQEQLPVAPGEVIVTSAGNLPGSHILHAITLDLGRIGFPRTTPKVIESCVRGVFAAAKRLGIRSLAIPAIGSGAAGLDLTSVTRAVCAQIIEALSDQASSVEDVVFCYIGSDESYIAKFRDQVLELAPIEVRIRRG